MTLAAGRPARGLLAVVAAALVSASCGVPLLKLPSGPGEPVSGIDDIRAYVEATGHCDGIRTLTAEVSVSGSAGGHRVRGRLLVGLANPSPASHQSPAVRLEAVAPFGAPAFIFVATDDVATLLLPRDGRVLERGRASRVLEALAGAPLGSAEIGAILAGCTPAIARGMSRAFGDTWREASLADYDVYLHRETTAARWQLAATIRHPAGGRAQWRAEFRDAQDGLPQSIRLTSLDAGGGAGAAFDLRLAVSQVETNVPLDAGAFTVQIPENAVPITLDELKQSGPLGGNGR